jgi:SNF2 family DNA or RNA helicase
MGLGKTCSMIALIAREKENREHSTAPYQSFTYGTMATLLVVPFSRERLLSG